MLLLLFNTTRLLVLLLLFNTTRARAHAHTLRTPHPSTAEPLSQWTERRRCDRRRRVQHNAHNLRTPKHGGRARLLRRRPRKNREKTRNWRFTNFAPTLTAEPS